jgi:hypothetical protein
MSKDDQREAAVRQRKAIVCRRYAALGLHPT